LFDCEVGGKFILGREFQQAIGMFDIKLGLATKNHPNGVGDRRFLEAVVF